jgi:hypothetical protein
MKRITSSCFTVLVLLALSFSFIACSDYSGSSSASTSSSSSSTSWSSLQKQIESEGFSVVDHKTANDRYYVLQKDKEYTTVTGGDYYVTCYKLSGSQTGGAGPYSKSEAQSIFNSNKPKMEWSIE